MPTSDWMKEHRQQKIANSQFHAGDTVAIVSGNWERSYSKRTIDKVYKNGNFTLVRLQEHETVQQYSPDWGGTIAHATGDGYGHYRSHVVPWNEEVEKAIADQKVRRELRAIERAIRDALANSRHDINNREALEMIKKGLELAGIKVKVGE